MRKTYFTASVVAIAIFSWIGSGFLREESPALPQSVALKNLALQAQNEDRPLTSVRVSTSYASDQDRSIRVRGQTQPERSVEVQAQISGLVRARPANRGDRVRTGDLLCELTVEDRNANLKEAAAVLSKAELEYQGVMKLVDKGLQSDAGIAAAEAGVAAAQAVVQRRLLEKSKLKIKAPFSGVIEEVHMEIGQFVTPGSVCATLVDLDPMLLVGEVSEHQNAGLKPKLPVTARLSDGRSILGEVRFVSQLANRGTRTYSLEAELPNIDGSIKGGLTAAIDIVTGSNKAHRISAALLVLDDEGNTGVRTVSEAGVVVFYQVDLISESSDGVWVAGLPEVVDLIVVGQQTVVAGERVEAKRISMDLTNAISQGAKQR